MKFYVQAFVDIMLGALFGLVLGIFAIGLFAMFNVNTDCLYKKEQPLIKKEIRYVT